MKPNNALERTVKQRGPHPWVPTGGWLALHVASGVVVGRSTRSFKLYKNPFLDFPESSFFCYSNSASLLKCIRDFDFWKCRREIYASDSVTDVTPLLLLLTAHIHDAPASQCYAPDSKDAIQ